MLNICIVFAQLERETIQIRVTDAYYARCKCGFYMGGRIPYGYRLTSTVIDNVRTSMYEEVPEESEQLKLIYSMYADTDNSLGDIVRYLNEHQIKNLRGANWSTARISEMLRNPVYVKADIDVYQFFQRPHKGFIPSKTWLACRIRCLNNRQSTKTCKPKNSWPVGKPRKQLHRGRLYGLCRRFRGIYAWCNQG